MNRGLLRGVPEDQRFLRRRGRALVAPGVGDGVEGGYRAGSLWLDELADEAYINLDPGSGAAAWRQLGVNRRVFAHVVADAAQTITTAVYTQFSNWGTVVSDALGFWSSGAKDRLTVPAGLAGLYLIGGSMSWDTNASGVRIHVLTKNGAIGWHQQGRFNAQGNMEFGGVVVASLVAGDYVGLQVFQNSGANRVCPESAGTSRSGLWLVRVAV